MISSILGASIPAVVEFGAGAVFLTAAVQKALHPEKGLNTLAYVSRHPRRDFVFLVIGEGLLGLALAGGLQPWLTVTVAIIVLMLFTLFIVLHRLGGRPSSCGCFGKAVLGDAFPVVRNLALILLLMGALLVRSASGGESVNVHPFTAALLLVFIVLHGLHRSSSDRVPG